MSITLSTTSNYSRLMVFFFQETKYEMKGLKENSEEKKY